MVTSRRQYLKLGAGVGAITLAGCLGLDDDGETSVTISTGGEGGTAFALVSALQSLVDEHSDSVSITNQTSPGYPSNFRLYDGGEIDAMAGDMVVFERARNDESPFDEQPVERIPHQGFMLANFDLYFMKQTGLDDLETTGDLFDYDLWPTPTAFATREVSEEVLRRAGYLDDLSIVDAEAGDIVGLLQQDVVDAIVVYGSNEVELAGWVNEVDASVDLEYLPFDDTVRQAIQDWEAVTFNEIDQYGWDQDIGADSIEAYGMGTQIFFGDHLSEDVVYEIANISHEHVDQAREAASSYPSHDDPEVMTLPIIEGPPVHPGVADFYQEHGVWNDAWTIGDVDD